MTHILQFWLGNKDIKIFTKMCAVLQLYSDDVPLSSTFCLAFANVVGGFPPPTAIGHFMQYTLLGLIPQENAFRNVNVSDISNGSIYT